MLATTQLPEVRGLGLNIVNETVVDRLEGLGRDSCEAHHHAERQ